MEESGDDKEVVEDRALVLVLQATTSENHSPTRGRQAGSSEVATGRGEVE
jgi:hypothetical protein